MLRLLGWAESSEIPSSCGGGADERPAGLASVPAGITPEFGVIERGTSGSERRYSARPLRRRTIYLLARHAFDDMGYRRLEWKCNALNAASRRAAERFGFSFEGVFRNHMVSRRETATPPGTDQSDEEWPSIRLAYEAWLAPRTSEGDSGRRKGTGRADGRGRR